MIIVSELQCSGNHKQLSSDFVNYNLYDVDIRKEKKDEAFV